MLQHLFLGFSLLGAEWVLYVLIILSIVSVTILFERMSFYKTATRGADEFRKSLRDAVNSGEWDRAAQIARTRASNLPSSKPDLESAMALALIQARNQTSKTEALTEIASDSVMRARVQWERSLSHLATIGNNAPFVGLFGTVLGIIKAFHDLSQQAGGAAVAGVTSGIADALVATAVGILVAIPATAAYNHYQKKTKVALQEAEALKSFLVGKLSAGDR